MMRLVWVLGLAVEPQKSRFIEVWNRQNLLQLQACWIILEWHFKTFDLYPFKSN